MLKIALTGGIASGKSLIRQFIEAEGLETIDADDVVHQLLANDLEIKTNIIEYFGRSVVSGDGKINRKALADVVFNNPVDKKILESWLHPKTREIMANFFKQQEQQGKKAAVAIIPLLFEAGQYAEYDVVWLLKTTEAQQISRLLMYRRFTEEEARQRIANQLPFEEKRQRLAQCPQSAIIDNTSSIEHCEQQVKMLVAKIKAQIS